MNRSFFAFLIVPVLALATGIFVLHYRAGVMEKATQDFCAAVEPGAAVKDVISLALRAGYTVNDAGEAANTLLVNEHHRQWLASYWGSGTFSSSDGQRFAVSGKVRNARALPTYFGTGRGVTMQTHSSDQKNDSLHSFLKWR